MAVMDLKIQNDIVLKPKDINTVMNYLWVVHPGFRAWVGL